MPLKRTKVETRPEPPTIAELGWCQFVTDYLEQALDAAKSSKSGLEHIRACDSCLRAFDDRDPRCYVNPPKKTTTLTGRSITTQMAWCPGCNIESDPDLAQAALKKAIEMNGPPKVA